jgi:hypothetical protein
VILFGGLSWLVNDFLRGVGTSGIDIIRLFNRSDCWREAHVAFDCLVVFGEVF